MLFKKFTNENASEKVTVKERLAYGCGDFSSNIMYSAMAAFLLFYYTDVVGVSAADMEKLKSQFEKFMIG